MVKKRMRMYSLTFILATFFVLVSANSRAQNNATRTLSGTVFDEDGISLPGVGVFIKGTNFNTITDVDGKYQLKISKKQLTVTYTYVGMKAQNITIPAGSRNVKKMLL